MRAAILVLALFGCDETPLAGVDLAAPADLAVDSAVAFSGDLAGGQVNLEAACAGTRIAGTCVVRFFQPFAACFAPAGRCGEFGRGSSCWESGARYELEYPGVSSIWSMNGATCLTWNEIVASDRQQYCTSETSPCTVEHTVDDGGLYHYSAVGGARYDPLTGAFTCPDGTEVDVGDDWGGCAALSHLLGAGCGGNDWSC